MRLPDGKCAPSGTEAIRILVADDEATLIEDYHYALVRPSAGTIDVQLAELHEELFGPVHANSSLPNIELVAVRQGQDAVLQVRRARDENRPFSIAFLDVRMPPGTNGIDAAAQIRGIDKNIHIVIVTAYTDVQTLNSFQQVPPAHRLFFLKKPFHAIEIQQLTTALTAKWQAERSDIGSIQPDPRTGRSSFFDKALLSLPGGIAVLDEDERIVQMNQALVNLFPDLRDSLQVGADYQAFHSRLAAHFLPEKIMLGSNGNSADCHTWRGNDGLPAERRLADNRCITIAEHALPSGGAVIQIHDVTALKATRQRHAISNSMNQFSRFAAILMDRLQEATTTAPYDVASDDSANTRPSAEEILKHLIPLARRQRLTPTVATLDTLTAEVAKEAWARLGDEIEIEVVSTVGLWPVFVDVARTKDALHKLISNAFEAMAGCGRITLETGNLHVSRDMAASFPGLRKGAYVQVIVKDNGSGMTPELIERAVMPFFTSKDPSAHLGLGLSDAYNFATQSGGCLDIQSDEHSGTTVRLVFPRAAAPAAMTDSSSRVTISAVG